MPTIRYKERFNKNHFEHTAWAENKLICGIDEVGRGCLAGPVVVAAVILFPNKTHRLLKDSKELEKEEREKVYPWILKNSWHATGFIHNRAIDNHNIYFSTLIAMKRAFIQLMTLAPQPHQILVDAMPLRLTNTAYEHIDVLHFPFGEKKSSSIAAASIVAKVTRDNLMHYFEQAFPGYALGKHKGYATPTHRNLVNDLGHSVIHRLNFIEGAGLAPFENDLEDQQSLF